MRALVNRFMGNEEGLETVEYAIVLGLIAVAALTAIGAMFQWVGGQFDTIDDKVATAGGGAQ